MLGFGIKLASVTTVNKNGITRVIDIIGNILGTNVKTWLELGDKITNLRGYKRTRFDLFGIGCLPSGKATIKDLHILMTKYLERPIGTRRTAKIG